MPRHSSNPPKHRSAGEAAKAASAPGCRVGETIVQSGIYRVLHAGHRVSHYVVLVSGQSFPRCARCGDQVRFELFEATSDIKNDPDFRVRLYEIPHPAPAAGDDDEKEIA
jgi:hypothetical protein